MQGSEGEVKEAEGGCWEWFKSVMPFGSGDPTLGQGLAKQVGNVTECALLGFLVELGELLTLSVRHQLVTFFACPAPLFTCRI